MRELGPHIEGMYANKKSPNEIGRKLGITKSQVTYHLKCKGLLRSQAEARDVSNQLRQEKWWRERSTIMHSYMTGKLPPTPTLHHYRNHVEKFTSFTLMFYGHMVKDFSFVSPLWPVDHIFSVYDGYYKLDKYNLIMVQRNRPLPLSLICHPVNLRQISRHENVIKNNRSFITLKELRTKVAEWNEVNGPIFPQFV